MNKTMTIEHPNGKGTGSAMRVAFHDLCGHGRNYVSVALAPQSSIGNEPTFDWFQSLHVELSRHDVASICRVIAGEREENERVRVKDESGRIKIFQFLHSCEEELGDDAHYRAAILRNDRSYGIVLDGADAYGLKCALDHALCPLVFEF